MTGENSPGVNKERRVCISVPWRYVFCSLQLHVFPVCVCVSRKAVDECVLCHLKVAAKWPKWQSVHHSSASSSWQWRGFTEIQTHTSVFQIKVGALSSRGDQIWSQRYCIDFPICSNLYSSVWTKCKLLLTYKWKLYIRGSNRGPENLQWP